VCQLFCYRFLKRPLLTVSRSFMNVAKRVLWSIMIILKANIVNLFVSSVLFVFWYYSPNVLDTTHICNISRLRVKERRIFWRLKEEALDRTTWRAGFRSGLGLVVLSWGRLLNEWITTHRTLCLHRKIRPVNVV
jgi:hypothetical protein